MPTDNVEDDLVQGDREAQGLAGVEHLTERRALAITNAKRTGRQAWETACPDYGKTRFVLTDSAALECEGYKRIWPPADEDPGLADESPTVLTSAADDVIGARQSAVDHAQATGREVWEYVGLQQDIARFVITGHFDPNHYGTSYVLLWAPGRTFNLGTQEPTEAPVPCPGDTVALASPLKPNVPKPFRFDCDERLAREAATQLGPAFHEFSDAMLRKGGEWSEDDMDKWKAVYEQIAMLREILVR